MSEQPERTSINSDGNNSSQSPSIMHINVSLSTGENDWNERNFNIRQQLLRELARLRSIMAGEGDPYKKIFETLPKKEQKEFREFYDHFSICPICSAENHKSYLLKFFLSKNPERIKLKESLMRIYRNLEFTNEDKYNNLNLGIPCCKCYSKLIKPPR